MNFVIVSSEWQFVCLNVSKRCFISLRATNKQDSRNLSKQDIPDLGIRLIWSFLKKKFWEKQESRIQGTKEKLLSLNILLPPALAQHIFIFCRK